QSGPARSPAELAIDAAIPRPEPANVPPPTINDFKPDALKPDTLKTDTAGPVSEAAKMMQRAAETKPSDVVAAPAADAGKSDAGKVETSKVDASKVDTKADTPKADTTKVDAGKNTATTTAEPAPATATPAVEPAKEATKAASNVPPADQPVADKLRDMLGTKTLRYFDRKAERAGGENFYPAGELARLWPGGGARTETGRGVIPRLRNGAADGLNAADY